MPLFGSSVQSTVGAGKSGAQSKKRFGPDAPWFFPVLMGIMFLAAPLALVVYGLCWGASNLRKVRSSRLSMTATVLTVIALLVSAFNGGPGALVNWYVEGFLSVYNTAGVLNPVITGLGYLIDVQTPLLPVHGLAGALLLTAPLSIPMGAWLGAFAAWWMEYRRQPLADLEGKSYLWERPPGFQDRARARRTKQAIATGAVINLKKFEIGCGIGKFGVRVVIDTRTLLTPTLIFGRPRSGKTMWAMSTIAQAISCGGGWIIIDFKGDGEVPAYAAQFAVTHGRRFLHFCPKDKSGTPYQQPAPGVPTRSANYDPLRSGDATSKTQMLLRSVAREGDAAAYFRSAEDIVQIAYQVARLTGYDQGRGGFEVLQNLLNMDTLQKVAMSSDPKTGRGYLADYPALLARVTQIVNTLKADPIRRGAVNDTETLLSTYSNGPAVGGLLRPGTPDMTIDLVQAVEQGHVVVFSLSVQDYGELSRTIGTLVLLDLQNAISVLRGRMNAHRTKIGQPNAKPPWDPTYVEVEEFGAAGPDAMLDVLNKSSDVEVRQMLSSQSWHDLVAVDGTGTFAKRVLAQASNFAVFAVNDKDEAEVMSGLTTEVLKSYARDSKEFSGGSLGANLKAANTGNITTTQELVRQANPGMFQELGNYDFIFIAKGKAAPGQAAPARITHSFKPSANRWVEIVTAVLVPADVQAPGMGDANAIPAAAHQPEPKPAVRAPAPRRAPRGEPQGVTQPIPVRHPVDHDDIEPVYDEPPYDDVEPTHDRPGPSRAAQGPQRPPEQQPAAITPAPDRRALSAPQSLPHPAWTTPAPTSSTRGFQFPPAEPVYIGSETPEGHPEGKRAPTTPRPPRAKRDSTEPTQKGSSDTNDNARKAVTKPATILRPQNPPSPPMTSGDDWDL